MFYRNFVLDKVQKFSKICISGAKISDYLFCLSAFKKGDDLFTKKGEKDVGLWTVGCQSLAYLNKLYFE